MLALAVGWSNIAAGRHFSEISPDHKGGCQCSEIISIPEP